jgi:hypothetical protein
MDTPPGWSRPHVESGAPLFEDPSALPRAWVVTRIEVQPDRARRLERFRSPDWDPATLALIEAPLSAAPPPGPASAARVLEHAPGRYRIEAAGPGLLVLSEAWFPGWTAAVDGADAPVRRANHFIQAVEIPPGRHEVVFAYRSTQLGRGLLLAAVGVALGIGLWVRARLRGRVREPVNAAGPA